MLLSRLAGAAPGARVCALRQAGAARARPIALLEVARQQRWSSSQTDYSSEWKELDRIVKSQDKHDRIRFEPPARFRFTPLDEWRRTAIRRRFPYATNITAELLPFYTVEYLAGLRVFYQDKATGGPAPPVFLSRAYNSNMGFSIAAVPKKHWAFGVVTGNDVPYMYGRHETSADTVKWGSASASVYYEGELPWFEPFLPVRAEPFAFGPPKPTTQEQRRIIEWQPTLNPDHEEFGMQLRDIRELQKPFTTFAFPHYRLIYKVECRNGEVGFIDTSTESSADAFLLHSRPASSPAQITDEYDDESCFKYWRRVWSKPLLMFHQMDEEIAQDYADLAVNMMVRNPISTETWEDPLMFPTTCTGENDVTSVYAYLAASVLDEGDVPTMPEYFKVPPKAPQLSAHLRARRTVQPRVAPKAKAEEEPVVDSRTARTSYRAAHVEQRKQQLSRRLKQQVERQKLWQASQASKAAQAEEEEAYRAGYPRPERRPQHDRKAYYKALGLDLRRELLLYGEQDAVDDEIQAAYYDLSKRYHPDYASSPEETLERHATMQRINVAYNHIKTCKERIAYHNNY